MKNIKGIYERDLGTGTWWIRYADATGRIRREKVGSKAAAIQLYRKRKTEVLQRKKLPENFRERPITFAELADQAIEWAKENKLTWQDDQQRLRPLVEAFGARTAESLTPQDIEKWFRSSGTSRNKDKARNGRRWRPATFNRYKALLSMVYRQGIKNGKVKENPARQVERRQENNLRERFLSEEEENALRAYLSTHFPTRLPEFEIAVHTGMRRKEQYDCEWNWVDLDAKRLTVPRSKHGEKRYVYLNDAAIAAFRLLWSFSNGTGKVFGHLYRSESTKGAREWFAKALNEIKITGFRWHDLRHTFASRLVTRGVSIHTVGHLMGHKTLQVTLRYAHLAPQHQLEAVQRLCDTGTAQNGATDTKTSTEGFEQIPPITASRQ